MPFTDKNRMDKFDRQTRLIATIKAAGNSGILKNDLEPLVTSTGTFSRDIAELIEKGKIKRSRVGNQMAYFFIDSTKGLNNMKSLNHEGYSDPTATAAVDSCECKMPGEIWSRKVNNGDTHDFLVIQSSDDFVTGVQLYDDTYYVNSDKKYICEFYSNAGKHYRYDCSRITTAPGKYFMNSYQSISQNDFEHVKESFAKYLDIGFHLEDKVVEKIVEVPVKTNDEDTTELKQQIAILEAKIEVYKEAFAAFGS